jgi:hypothetical protein
MKNRDKLIANLSEVQGTLRHHLNDAESASAPKTPDIPKYPYTEVYAYELRAMLKLIIECKRELR